MNNESSRYCFYIRNVNTERWQSLPGDYYYLDGLARKAELVRKRGKKNVIMLNVNTNLLDYLHEQLKYSKVDLANTEQTISTATKRRDELNEDIAQLEVDIQANMSTQDIIRAMEEGKKFKFGHGPGPIYVRTPGNTIVNLTTGNLVDIDGIKTLYLVIVVS